MINCGKTGRSLFGFLSINYSAPWFAKNRYGYSVYLSPQKNIGKWFHFPSKLKINSMILFLMLHENLQQQANLLDHNTFQKEQVLKIYFSSLNIPETEGLGTDICFFGANDDESGLKKLILPPDPANLLLILMRFDRSLVFLWSGEIAFFLGGYNIGFNKIRKKYFISDFNNYVQYFMYKQNWNCEY